MLAICRLYHAQISMKDSYEPTSSTQPVRAAKKTNILNKPLAKSQAPSSTPTRAQEPVRAAVRKTAMLFITRQYSFKNVDLNTFDTRLIASNS